MTSSVLDQPVSSLDKGTVICLGGELTLRNTKSRDWTGVASIVGFTYKQVELLQQHQDSGKGILLLNTWEAIGGCSVRKLLYALIELKLRQPIALIQEDEHISDEDILEVTSEHEQLKEDGALRPCTPISDLVFMQVLYERPTQYTPHSTPKTEISQVERNTGQQCPSPDFTREPKTVYISYVSESGFSKTTNAVNKLADFICRYGFRVHYKPYSEKEIRQMGGVNEWKEHCIQTSETIVVVCTPAYFREDKKCLSSQAPQLTKPSKLCVDSRLLRTLAYSSSERKRLIPVVLDSKKPLNWTECVPIWMQSSQFFNWPSRREDLAYSLVGEPKYVIPPPPPGKIIVVKPKVIGFPKQYSARIKPHCTM